ncbi:MAG: hypothetical protein HC825_02530 [Oscillatoriales cyanobacterium RM1_1_9]|nr:hypothetical protein [Oscillatoriales cyanobacterium RM2_1_1]NJO70869.1 hypothetical protein [Oscillatoriales cyanobacterium RM1_1_9]
MRKLTYRLTSASSLMISAVVLATLPAQADIFYDMQFFDEAGSLIGSGEFSATGIIPLMARLTFVQSPVSQENSPRLNLRVAKISSD